MRRQTYLDNISAVLILYMIFFVHCARYSGMSGAAMDRFTMVMEFFMAWFFFKSGMFYKEKPLKDVLKNNVRHLLKPFFLFSIIGWIIVVPAENYFFGNQDFGSLMHDTLMYLVHDGAFRGNYALWFLLSLFLVKSLFPLFRKAKLPVIVIAITSLALAYLHNSYYQYTTPLYFGNVPNGLFFYSLGYMMREIQFSRLVLISALVVAVCIFPFLYDYFDFRTNTTYLHTNSFLLHEAFMLGEIIIVNGFAHRWLTKESFMSEIGRNTMIYYVTHYIFLVISFQALHILFGIGESLELFIINSIVLIVMMYAVHRLFKNEKLRRFCF